MCQLNWTDIVAFYGQCYGGQGTSQALACVLLLLVQCYGDQKHVEVWKSLLHYSFRGWGGGGVTNSYNTCLKIYHFVLKSEVDVIADTVSHYCISSCTVFPGVKVTMVNKYCNMSILIINFFLLQIPTLEQKTLTAETYDWSTLTSDNYRHASNWFLQTCDPRCVLAERSSSMALGLRLESLENDEINLCTALNRSLLFS